MIVSLFLHDVIAAVFTIVYAFFDLAIANQNRFKSYIQLYPI